MKKKILFVTKALWIGGIETALINLLNQIDYTQFDVTLLLLKNETDLLNRVNPNCNVLIADRDVRVSFEKSYKYSRLYHLTEEAENPSRLHRMLMFLVPAICWLENRLFIRYVQRGMKKFSFDTAIIYSDVVGEIAVRAIKTKQFLMFYHHGAMRHVYHDLLPWKRCKKVIAVSGNQASLMRDYFSKYADKITVIHNFTDVTSIINKGNESISEVFDSRYFNIVSVGRVSHEKGMDLAVRACAKVIKDGYKNVRLWIVGDGPDMNEVVNTIREMNMGEYVYTLGMKSNPYPYIKQADLYVQPSRFEGYPMTVLEALILGQPVLSTNNNGAREILDKNDIGLLCPIDSDKIASAIEYFLNNPDELMQLKRNVGKLDFVSRNHDEMLKLEEIIGGSTSNRQD